MSGRRTEAVGIAGETRRVRHVAALDGRSMLTVEGEGGLDAVVVPAAPDAIAARSATAGLRRLQWVRLHLDGPTPTARLAGTTRFPQVRIIPLGAALALAAEGLPTFVSGEGD